MCSVNAKDIGVLYIITGVIGGIIGYTNSIIIRNELTTSGKQFITDINYNEIYNVLITMLGLLMIFYFVVPILIGGFGNYLVPIQIGSIDMSMARLNNISLWMTITGLIILILSSVIDYGSGTGWTLYVPLSTIEYSSSSATDLLIFSLLLGGIGSLLGSINIITTILNNRVKGLSLLEAGIFTWSVLITNILLLLALPILAVGITMILTDRNLNTSFYSPEYGGDIILYQHLFWLFGLPEVSV